MAACGLGVAPGLRATAPGEPDADGEGRSGRARTRRRRPGVVPPALEPWPGKGAAACWRGRVGCGPAAVGAGRVGVHAKRGCGIKLFAAGAVGAGRGDDPIAGILRGVAMGNEQGDGARDQGCGERRAVARCVGAVPAEVGRNHVQVGIAAGAVAAWRVEADVDPDQDAAAGVGRDLPVAAKGSHREDSVHPVIAHREGCRPPAARCRRLCPC